ncbi:SRPBCC family protein [Sphingomonas pseudosanguinis]|uniref:SRPBCC domain-containing protein n=1 Tax=Sphingomonas pseudosanguinis TaxID=413712 RepID=A0A7W6F4F3_9SPHN|nr:SRPBCC family protein [Sphingomonas pseudosanguinis]MBB3880921.1 hypothetical protein [Sphingomonas pseudosanguinis]MBN3535790.1 SRPBCC domain-containing protein [Sphingomonas pseudosanguinis]
MPQTVTRITLHGGPLRIWSALTDPGHRKAWSPLVLLDASDELGDTECAFAITGWSKPVRTPARVDRLDKPDSYAWSCGIPYLFEFEERFDLSGDDGGTQLTHTVTLRGALSYPMGTVMLRRLRTLMVEADDRLATYLRWRVGHSVRGTNRQRVPQRYRSEAR